MSSLLERMAKRARAPLNAAQPLQLPRFAPRQNDGLPAEEALVGMPEATGDAPEPAGEPGQAPEAVIRPGEPSPKRNPAHRAEPPPTRVGTLEAPMPEPALPRRKASKARPAPRLPTPAEPRPATSQEPASLPKASDAEERPRPVDQPAIANAALPPTKETPGDRPERRRRGERPAVEAAAEPRPEVTIAIGHIEVRGVPEPPRPQARPPFRPRLSLDEFLKAGGR